MKRVFFLFTLIALLFPPSVFAEVYLLGRGGGAGGSQVGRFTGSNTSPLHVEAVISNGKKFFLEIYKSTIPLQEIYARLKKTANKKII